MKSLAELSVKLYMDGADKQGMLTLYHDPLVQGLTTNPTLMRKAGVKDYEGFTRDILQTVVDKPISFEVFSDDLEEMRRQAVCIASWQSNVYVKIPITNTAGESCLPLIKELCADGVQVNVTALLTEAQVAGVVEVLDPSVAAVISVFAGRIADTGRDPVPVMESCRRLMASVPKAELLWASVREVLNIQQADDAGCDIITVPQDILAKALKMWGRDTSEVSLDTVKMFREDAVAAGFTIVA